MLKHFDHVTVAVTDPAAAIGFFALLGFELDKDVVIKGPVMDQYMGIANLEARHITLALKDSNPRLEVQLLHFLNPSVKREGGIAIRRAQRPREHDRYTVGLHHFAWNADSRQDVDRLHDRLKQSGATILDAPAEYPQYGAGYYAVFFADPDGLKLEFVHWP